MQSLDGLYVLSTVFLPCTLPLASHVVSEMIAYLSGSLVSLILYVWGS